MIAKIMLHHWEEPCISGGEDGVGSGAVFFSGCPLKCVYCQNKAISRGETGTEYSAEALAARLIRLRRLGAYNLNFVTPTHYTPQIIEALELARRSPECDGSVGLGIPVVWNTSGYERRETVESLRGYADVFLTDFKYFSSELSLKYSAAPDYAEFATEALKAMVELTGPPVFDDATGLIKSGTVVRHLVLPGAREDSAKVLRAVADSVGAQNVILSLMSQYTPEFLDQGFPQLSRRITTFEYDRVLSEAVRLGFNGYFQDRRSATKAYTPNF